MKYAVEMGPATTIYIPSFMKTGSGIQKLMSGVIHRQHRDRMTTFILFKIRKLGSEECKSIVYAFSYMTV
jgi:hypothetical protein